MIYQLLLSYVWQPFWYYSIPHLLMLLVARLLYKLICIKFIYPCVHNGRTIDFLAAILIDGWNFNPSTKQIGKTLISMQKMWFYSALLFPLEKKYSTFVHTLQLCYLLTYTSLFSLFTFLILKLQLYNQPIKVKYLRMLRGQFKH